MHIKPYSNRSKLSKSQLTWDQKKVFNACDWTRVLSDSMIEQPIHIN